VDPDELEPLADDVFVDAFFFDDALVAAGLRAAEIWPTGFISLGSGLERFPGRPRTSAFGTY